MKPYSLVDTRMLLRDGVRSARHITRWWCANLTQALTPTDGPVAPGAGLSSLVLPTAGWPSTGEQMQPKHRELETQESSVLVSSRLGVCGRNSTLR